MTALAPAFATLECLTLDIPTGIRRKDVGVVIPIPKLTVNSVTGVSREGCLGCLTPASLARNSHRIQTPVKFNFIH